MKRLIKSLFRKRNHSERLDRQELGKLGEDYACRHLERENYAVLERNFRCPLGEIDIIAREDDTIVIIEVKAQYAHTNIRIERKIDARKRKKLTMLSRFYRSSRLSSNAKCRIDVITIKINSDHTISELKHYKRAV